MKHLPAILFSTLLAISTGLCAPESNATPARLKVMTYNVRIGVGGGPWHTEPARISLEPVARLIEEHAPDLIGLQEVDQARQRSGRMDQPAFLSSRLKMNVEFVPAYTVAVTNGMDEKYGVAMLNRGRIVSSERIPLFKPDYSRETKYPDYYSEQRVLMHAEVLIDGWKVHVFVTHLGLTEDQRERQIKQIAETAARFEGPKILMGDFNANPSEPAMKVLDLLFQDALAVVKTPLEARRSYPAGTMPKQAIDYIFVSREFKVVSARVIRDASLASDHNPVVAELELER